MTATFVNLWNFHNGVPTRMFYLLEQYGKAQTVFKSQMTCYKKHSLNRDSAENGHIAFNFMDEAFLRTCEHFLPDIIEISLSEKVEAYSFLKHIFRI